MLLTRNPSLALALILLVAATLVVALLSTSASSAKVDRANVIKTSAPRRQQFNQSSSLSRNRKNYISSSSSNNNNGRQLVGDPKISYETKWFTQLVDHFTWANQDTWQQRYLVNRDHWCGQNCPILFYTGNEGDIEVFTNNTGWMWENAEQLRAMLVFVEHRFYGQSMPYKIDPTQVRPDETSKLGYLSSEQALADFALFAYELKNTLYDAKYSPIITVGGSYGGMLAAWMRMKYPNLILGALAGSAPILQFSGEYNCQDFSKIVTNDYENYSRNCSTSIAKSWSVMRNMGSSSEGLVQMSRLFNTCKPMKQDEVVLLNELLSSIWVNMAMTDYANAATFLSNMPAYPIKHACAQLQIDPLLTDDLTLLAGISRASQVYTNSTGQLKCLDIRSFLFDPMDVLWDFQSCTEMVMPICSDGVNDMFDPAPFNVTDIVSQCKTRWGVNTQVNKIQTVYGNKNLQAASNIIFSSCSRDPWSAGCPQDSFESSHIHAIKIPGVCHHEDLRMSGPNDSDALKKARQDELNIITDWIQKHYKDLHESAPANTLIWSNKTVEAVAAN